jgi:hypothetical protein
MDTFVLRIWAPAPGMAEAGSAPAGAHGTAHHVVSGRSGVFRSEEQLIRLLGDLQREAAQDDDHGLDGGAPRAGLSRA